MAYTPFESISQPRKLTENAQLFHLTMIPSYITIPYDAVRHKTSPNNAY
jgi:hypothetical protein